MASQEQPGGRFNLARILEVGSFATLYAYKIKMAEFLDSFVGRGTNRFESVGCLVDNIGTALC